MLSAPIIILSVFVFSVLIAMSVWLISKVVRAARVNFALVSRGRIANATVLRREEHHNLLIDLIGIFVGGSGDQYYLHYQFAVPTSEGEDIIQSKHMTWKSHYDKYVEGSTIEICYLPDDPRTSLFTFSIVWFPRSLEQARLHTHLAK